MRRHRGSRNTRHNNPPELFVGGGTAKAPGSKIHIEDGIPVGTVAEGAIVFIQAGASVNVRLAIFLPEAARDRHKEEDRERQKNQPFAHCVDFMFGAWFEASEPSAKVEGFVHRANAV